MENPVNLKLKDVKTLLLKCAVIITENNYIILIEVLLKWQMKKQISISTTYTYFIIKIQTVQQHTAFFCILSWGGVQWSVSVTCEIALLYFISLLMYLSLSTYMAWSHHSSDKKWSATHLENCQNNFTYSVITTYYIDNSSSFLNLNTTKDPGKIY